MRQQKWQRTLQLDTVHERIVKIAPLQLRGVSGRVGLSFQRYFKVLIRSLTGRRCLDGSDCLVTDWV